ncbi:MAG: ABC transporter ATP-binding protein/permease [Clostridiales bacterium]|jgi:ATP-binding cassette subfamily B protein|nr:ABC transporter ATP-binding protein/permease [Clostridiales bacterium]
MTGGLVLKTIGAVAELALPRVLAYLVDTVAPTGDYGAIALCGAVMLLCAVAAFLFNVWANRTAAWVAMAVTRSLRRDLFTKINLLSCRKMDEFTVPSVISRLTSNTYDVNHMLGVMQRMGVRAPILVLGGIAMTLTLDPMLTLVLVGAVPLIFFAVFLITKMGIKRYAKAYEAQDGMVRIVRENATGIRIIKALSKTEHEKARFDEHNAALSKRETRAAALMGLSSPIMNLILNLGLVGVLAVGAVRIDNGDIKPGVIIAFLTYFTIILNALIAITRVFVIYSRALASSRRIFEVMNTQSDMPLAVLAQKEDAAHIRFENVGFSYLGKKENVSDVSFALHKGQTLGIVGGVGSGKTTLVKLLLRFYDVDRGSITIDGRDVRGIPPAELYRMFGVVFQHDILFAASVTENVDFYRGVEASVPAALEAAQADGFVAAFADGAAHRLAIKGADLSGGQRQRLLLARALAGRSPVLILDDASSALDYKTDAALRGAIAAHYADATKVIVAQRVSSIRHADLILVLDGGRVVGQGTHERLMQGCAIYQEMAALQMGEVT